MEPKDGETKALLDALAAFVHPSPMPTKRAGPENVSLVQLIANPEKFDGKLVRVIGFLELGFESNRLYLHRQDYDHSISRNSIWVDIALDKATADLCQHYVLLEGVFDSQFRGHMDVCSGSLSKIQRAELWRGRIDLKEADRS